MNCSIGQSWYHVRIRSRMAVRAKTRSNMLITWLYLYKTYIKWLIFDRRFGWSWSHVGIPSRMVIHARTRSKMLDPWYLILDTWSMIHDPWAMIHDPWYLIFNLWSMIHDPWLVHDPWSMTWSMILDPWSMIHDPWWEAFAPRMSLRSGSGPGLGPVRFWSGSGRSGSIGFGMIQ